MIESLARRAGVLLKDGFGKEHQVDFKHAKDLVTEMDRKAEDLILGEIRDQIPRPQHPQRGERIPGRAVPITSGSSIRWMGRSITPTTTRSSASPSPTAKPGI